MAKQRSNKMDWQGMEMAIRKVLRGVAEERIQHFAGIVAIDNIVGYYTERGYTLDMVGTTLRYDPEMKSIYVQSEYRGG